MRGFVFNPTYSFESFFMKISLINPLIVGLIACASLAAQAQNLAIVNGKPVPKPNSKYEERGAFPMKMLFDYSISSRG